MAVLAGDSFHRSIFTWQCLFPASLQIPTGKTCYLDRPFDSCMMELKARLISRGCKPDLRVKGSPYAQPSLDAVGTEKTRVSVHAAHVRSVATKADAVAAKVRDWGCRAVAAAAARGPT